MLRTGSVGLRRAASAKCGGFAAPGPFLPGSTIRQAARCGFGTTSHSKWHRAEFKPRKLKNLEAQYDKRVMTPEELFAQASNIDVKNIMAEYEKRKNVRDVAPNKKWLADRLPEVQLGAAFDYTGTLKNQQAVEKVLSEKFGPIRKNIKIYDMYYSELDVGDVVDLSGRLSKSELAVVVELPRAAIDPRYTLITQFGGLVYVSRSRMGFRIPRVFPREWFTGCIMDEMPFIAGCTDAGGNALVPAGHPKCKTEETVENLDIPFGGAVAKASVAAGTSIQSYITPSLLSGIVSRRLTLIISKTWFALPETNLKMEVLHNVLQSAESPVTLSFVQLLTAVLGTDLNSMVSGLNTNNNESVCRTYKKLHEHLANAIGVDNQFDSITLGRSALGRKALVQQVSTIALYALVLSLRKNGLVYRFNSGQSRPTFVTVVPLDQMVRLNRLVHKFKADEKQYGVLCGQMEARMAENGQIETSMAENGQVETSMAENGQMENRMPEREPENAHSAPKQHSQDYQTFIWMLKLYISSSFKDDVLESFILKVIRGLSAYKDVDITAATVYELLLRLNEIGPNDNPFKWSYSAEIPHSSISAKADTEQRLYDAIGAENVDRYVDLDYDIAGRRKKYDSSTPIFCIDSEDPLEIDDGIGLRQTGDHEYVVSSFIANPSSFLRPDFNMAKIAFERGQTLYLPDVGDAKTVSMLPAGFVGAVQLGMPGRNTRVMRISFKINTQTGKIGYLGSRSIEFGQSSAFVKVDYGRVNEILAGTPRAGAILADLAGKSSIEASKIDQDLKILSQISELLAEIARKNGRVDIFGSLDVSRGVKRISAGENGRLTVEFKPGSQSGKAERLVSEIMVMSNHVAGKMLAENRIPGLFRAQNRLPMSAEVRKHIERLVSKGKYVTYQDMAVIQEYLTKSATCPFSSRHESLAVDSYATVTSPLRRYADMVNQWQLQAFVQHRKPHFSQFDIDNIALTLGFKNEINRRFSRKVSNFYMFKILAQTPGSKFKCVVTGKPSSDGEITVTMLDYGVRCSLRTSWYALGGESTQTEREDKVVRNFEIGDVIDDAVVSSIDLMNGQLVLESASC